MTISDRLRSGGIKLRRNPGYLVIAALVAGAIAWPLLTSERGPSYSRTFVPVDQTTALVWQRTIPWVLASPALDAKRVYYYDSTKDTLVALNAADGGLLWEESGSPAIYGVSGIAADGERVYIVNATHVAAYSAPNGDLIWSRELGSGHVRVQLGIDDPALLRVYYGDAVFELSRETGEMEKKVPLDDLLWIAGDVTVRSEPPGLAATSSTALTPLWRSYVAPFDVAENLPPLDLFPHLLVYIHRPTSICALDLRDGHYQWCTPLSYSSNMVLGPSGAEAYVLDGEHNIISLAIATGDSRTIASFPAPETAELDPHRGFTYGLGMYADALLVYIGDTSQLFSLKTETN